MPDSLRLSEFNQLIKNTLEGTFAGQSYWIIGEISNLKLYPAKSRCYLTLVETQEGSDHTLAELRANVWGYSFQRVTQFEQATGQAFNNGIEILVRVGVDFHIKFGLSVSILDIDYNYTLGQLQQRREAVLAALLQKDPDHVTLVNGEYVTTNKQASFPPAIQSIALISSPNAEGYRDFRNELDHNAHGYRFHVDDYPAQVQGEKADEEITDALVKIYLSKKAYDAVAIVRGGGSRTDFTAFDTFRLARAVARFPIAIITGIGHERDQTLIDLLAHTSVKTPTRAAAFIVEHNQVFEKGLQLLQKRMLLKVQDQLSQEQLALSQLNRRLITQTRELLSAQALLVSELQGRLSGSSREFLGTQQFALADLRNRLLSQTKDYLSQQKDLLSPMMSIISRKAVEMVNVQQHDLQMLKLKLANASESYLKEKQYNLNYYLHTVRHLKPENVLRRGYAIVYQGDEIVTDPGKLQLGSEIKTVFYQAELNSRITQNKRTDGTGPDL